MSEHHTINANLKPLLARLEVATQKTRSTQNVIGKYKSFYKGMGLEFDGYREYSTSDDANKIDWKASLRANELLVKEFEQSKNLALFMLIDVSDSMIAGTTEKLKNEYAAEVAGFLAFNILVEDDAVGYGMYTDVLKRYRRPSRGNKQFYIMAKDLMEIGNYGGKTGLSNCLSLVNSFLPHGSVLIIISDFLHVSESDMDSLRTAGQKFELIAVIVRDPIDYALPKGTEVLVADPYTGAHQIIDTTKVGKAYEENAKLMLASLKETLLHSNIDVAELRTDQGFSHPLMRFFKQRQAKWK